MSIFTRKPPAEPTLAERHDVARDIAFRATAIFQGVVDDLQDAGHLHAVVADDIEAEINRLAKLRIEAEDAAMAAYVKAESIAGLL